MPCYDPRGYEDMRTNERLAAVLCGFCRVLERRGQLEEIKREVDWPEVGTGSVYFDEWWRDHKAKDAERQSQEEG